VARDSFFRVVGPHVNGGLADAAESTDVDSLEASSRRIHLV